MHDYLVTIGGHKPRLIRARDAGLAWAIARHAADARGDEVMAVRLARPEEIHRLGPPIEAPPRAQQLSLYF